MASCINKNSVQYQTLKNRSGLSEFVLESVCRGFINRHGRWPNLDELPDADSTSALKTSLNLNKDGFTKVQTILDFTGTETIEDAIVELNKQFSDLEVSVINIGDEAIVKSIRRPNQYNLNETTETNVDAKVNMPVLLNHQLQRLSSLYGIKFIPIDTQELIHNEEYKDFPIDAQSNKGFIYNGDIYINVDNYSADTPVHELMHLLFGSIRFTNPELYLSLTSKAEKFRTYDMKARALQNRTKQDLNEELFIQEFSKYLVGYSSEITDLSPEELYEVTYNINRVLDSILMGQDSVKTITTKYTSSLRQLAKAVGSTALENKMTLSLSDANIHRTLSNMKSDLIKNGELKEYC